MAGEMVQIPINSRDAYGFVKLSKGSVSFTDLVFGLEESDEWPGNSISSGDDSYDELEDENPCNLEDKKAFWENQDQLLQATLYRTGSLESKIRQTTKEALKEIEMARLQCVCRKPVTDGCRKCLQNEIANRLRNEGFNSMICKSKWRKTAEIPSGEHSYIEVMEKLSESNKSGVRVIIELKFREEFEMARGSEEYKRLISRLPEVYVGKSERLKALIKILCAGAKKCMKEKKMHLGPWRKHKYMQAKWFGTVERVTPVPEKDSDALSKARVSMISFDLAESLIGLHCNAIEVL